MDEATKKEMIEAMKSMSEVYAEIMPELMNVMWPHMEPFFTVYNKNLAKAIADEFASRGLKA